MEHLIKREDGITPSKEETKEIMELFSSNEFGVCIKFKDGRICNVQRKDNGDVILLTHEPFFEFEDENELSEYLPVINKP
jgi:hypothetical protein